LSYGRILASLTRPAADGKTRPRRANRGADRAQDAV
jgi:hypothetical protein